MLALLLFTKTGKNCAPPPHLFPTGSSFVTQVQICVRFDSHSCVRAIHAHNECLTSLKTFFPLLENVLKWERGVD